MFRIRFLRNIMLTSVAIVVVLPLYDVLVAYPSFVDSLTQDARDESVSIARHLVLVLDLHGNELEKESLASRRGVIESMMKNFDLVKIKAYSPRGEVIYTTDPADTEHLCGHREFREGMSRGEAYAELKRKGTESMEHREVAADVVETYVPIVKDGRFLGAFEIYRDVTARRARLAGLKTESTVLVSVAALGMLVLVVMASHKAGKNILARERMASRLRQLSVTDELTGLHNRRGFCSLAEQQLRIANRQGREMLMVCADLDGLKTINDTFGHQEGDRALAAAAAVLRESVREADIVARIGGDEFVVLAAEPPGTNPEVLAARIEENIAAQNASAGKPYELSLSVGAIRCDDGPDCTLASLLKAADEAMYRMKSSRHSGRSARAAR
jgi:diguanylate cyclase (GGDEF)-like protein